MKPVLMQLIDADGSKVILNLQHISSVEEIPSRVFGGSAKTRVYMSDGGNYDFNADYEDIKRAISALQ